MSTVVSWKISLTENTSETFLIEHPILASCPFKPVVGVVQICCLSDIRFSSLLYVVCLLALQCIYWGRLLWHKS